LIHFVIDENADGPRRYVPTAVTFAGPGCGALGVEQLIDLTA
jgi:hypothetical protein